MSRVFIENTSLQNIADAIRIKNGSSDEYYPSEMAQAIEDIPSGDMCNYLRFVAIENSSIGIITQLAVNFEYSSDMITWNNWTYTVDGNWKYFAGISISAGNCIYVRGNNSTIGNSSANKTTRFTMTGKIAAYGSVMSLLSSSVTTVPANGFYRLFYNCTSLIKAPELPSTNLSSFCYSCMFQGCTGLIQMPELPATTMQNYCYNSMFSGCTGLIYATELPATTFNGGTACYAYMFAGCTNLIKSPNILATPLYSSCFSNMFFGCSKLSEVYVSATSWNTSYCSYWLYGVSSVGTFTKPSGTTIPTGVNGIPDGWTVINI